MFVEKIGGIFMWSMYVNMVNRRILEHEKFSKMFLKQSNCHEFLLH